MGPANHHNVALGWLRHTMGRKGKLFGLLAVLAAIGLVTASGAFTTVSAERTASVNVAGDANALLALDPTSGPNGQTYADVSNGQLELDLANGSAAGVNPNAKTTVTSVFRITNQGTQKVSVKISDSGDNSDAVTFYNSTDAKRTDGGLESSEAALAPGESIVVSIEIDTTTAGVSANDNLIDEITITAEAA